MKLPLMVISVLTFEPAVISPPAFSPTNEQRNGTDASSLDGTYLCEGVRADGTTYTGTVVIVRHSGAYRLIWTVGSEEQYLGLGILNGDVLAVSYFGGLPGVVAYKVDRAKGNPRLSGHWTVATADGQVFDETLTRLTREVKAPPSQPDRRPQRVHPLLLGRSA